MASLPIGFINSIFIQATENPEAMFQKLEPPTEEAKEVLNIIFGRDVDAKIMLAKNYEHHEGEQQDLASILPKLYSKYFYNRNIKQLPNLLDGLTPIKRNIVTALIKSSPVEVVDADLLAAQVRHSTSYPARTSDIAKSIVRMSSTDADQLCIMHIVRGIKESSPFYVGIQCIR